MFCACMKHTTLYFFLRKSRHEGIRATYDTLHHQTFSSQNGPCNSDIDCAACSAIDLHFLSLAKGY
jgi:hypothetical protein